MSETGGDTPEFERQLRQEQELATVLKGGLVLITGDDEPVSARLGAVAVALADETEVVRLDASQAHTASALTNALARALDRPAEQLLDELVRRGEHLPLALVIDNGECLGNRALILLRDLLANSRGGLGVVIGGEPELTGLLEQARLEPGFTTAVESGEADAATAGAPDAAATGAPGWLATVPWKHLAAVVGLLLLVLLFWSGAQEPSPETASKLELPPPRTPSRVDPPPAQRPRPAPAEVAEPHGQPAPRPQPGGEAGPDGSAARATAPRPDPADATDSAPSPGTGSAGEADGAVEPGGLNAELAYHSEDWLLTRAPEHWMLQLALAVNEKRARTLLDRLGRDQGAYYRARRNGEVVYIVLAGPFGSRDQAQGARGGLPAWFRERGAFPRRVGAIADEIRKLSGTGG